MVASSGFSHIEQLGLSGSSLELQTEGQVFVHSDVLQPSVARAVSCEDEAGTSRGGGREEADENSQHCYRQHVNFSNYRFGGNVSIL